jgi:hypothetical protein
VTVPEARIDTRAAHLSLPPGFISRLGLKPTGLGPSGGQRYGPVRLTVRGQSATMDVPAESDGQPVTIGRLALAQLDFEAVQVAGG